MNNKIGLISKKDAMKSKIKEKYFNLFFNKYLPIIEELSAVSTDKCFYKEYMKNNISRILFDVKIIKSIINKGNSILDIGSNPPLLIALLKKEGFQDLTVADPLVDNFKLYYNNYKIKNFPFDIIDNNYTVDNVYDAVCLCEVIEHIPGDPRDTLKIVKNFIKPGGKLFLTTPNLRSISGFCTLLINNSSLASKPFENILDQYNLYSKYGYYGHLREYTEKEIILFCESIGLQHVQTIMQPDYRLHPRMKIIGAVEKLFPKFRLMGKYIFVNNC